MKFYSVTTLGCKVNQCESAAMANLLDTAGYHCITTDEEPNLIVINTCTVTGKAAMQSRQTIRQAIRNHPRAKIIVTGCYAQTAPDEIQSIPGVNLIVGHGDKLNVTQFLKHADHGSDEPILIQQDINKTRCFAPLPLVAPENRTRAFLKIQDGCNAFCTYCIVPYARGRSRSMPTADVQAHLQKLTNADFREVVLTGIHLGAYGKDLNPATSLAELLTSIPRLTSVERLRISSIEPTEVDSNIIHQMADPENPLCPHFHIPLQSGDNRILKRMARPYTREQFAHTISDIHRQLPRAAIGVDVLVGFPGETETAFEQTYALIHELPVTYLHVFPFSPRKGTPAAGFKGMVPNDVVKERCRRMRLLGEEKKRAFYGSLLNQTVKVLVETTADSNTGHPKGFSDNYVPIILPRAQVKENTIVSVSISKVRPDGSVLGYKV